MMPSFSLCTQWWVSIARIVAVAAQDMCGHHIDSVVDFFASVLLTIFMVVMMMMTTTTTITSTRIVRFVGYDVKYEYTMWLYDDNGNDDGSKTLRATVGLLFFFVTRYGKSTFLAKLCRWNRKQWLSRITFILTITC